MTSLLENTFFIAQSVSDTTITKYREVLLQALPQLWRWSEIMTMDKLLHLTIFREMQLLIYGLT